MMTLKAAFLFVAPGADPAQHRSIIRTPSVELTTVGVSNYSSALQVVADLTEQGVTAIELCGGFGIDGTAAVNKAAAGKAVVGVVRFDSHPGLGFKGGDEIFR